MKPRIFALRGAMILFAALGITRQTSAQETKGSSIRRDTSTAPRSKSGRGRTKCQSGR
jgi:hypothetical protein